MNRLKAAAATLALTTGVALTAAPAASATAAQGAAAGSRAVRTQAALASSTPAAPLLMIHGFMDSCHDAFDYDPSGWDTSNSGGYGTATTFLAQRGFTNQVQIGYYNSNHPQPGIDVQDYQTNDGHDTQCDDNLQNSSDIAGSATGANAYSGQCNNIDTNSSDYGGTNDPISRLGCLLAWFIYDHYTLQDQPVNVLAHSMGGLIIRYAIGATNAGVADFPPQRLLVSNVVTVATPHQGLPENYYLAALALDGSSNELSEMDASSGFLSTLSGSAYQEPQGLIGTYWTLMGASDGPYGPGCINIPPAGGTVDGGNLISCVLSDGDAIVASSSAMGMQSNAKILYGVQQGKLVTCDTGICSYQMNIADLATQYEHEVNMPCGGITIANVRVQICFTVGPYYLNDTGTGATKAWECHNCGAGIPGGNPVTESRSLAAIATGLQQYSALCVAGRFSNGIIDQAILSAYNSNGGVGTLGCPFDNGGGIYVHYWSGPQANVQDFTGGSFGPAILVDGPQGGYFVNYGFRTAYITGKYNSTCLAPTDNAYSYNGGTRQDFVNCYMTWTSAGGVVVHGPNPNSCTNYGGTTMTGPNGCVGFTTAPPSGKPASGNVWYSGGGVGLYGQEIWTYGNGTVATSTADYTLYGLGTTRAYQLQAYIPNNYSDAAHAHYHYCGAADGCADGYVNQNNYTNAWAAFGTACTTNGIMTITLADDGGDVYPAIIGADAIRAVATGIQC